MSMVPLSIKEETWCAILTQCERLKMMFLVHANPTYGAD